MDKLKAGDIITFEGIPKWYTKILIWLKIVKPKPLNQFKVTSINYGKTLKRFEW